MAGLEQYARPAPQVPIGDIGKLTKLGVQTLFPETYQAATNWIPSMGDIFSGSVPYWILMLLVMIMIWAWPVLATWLPSNMLR